MRVMPFAAEATALVNPKAMLLINDGDGEVVKLNAILNQGVRTNHNVD
jgi:hypothetical protein